MTGHEQKEINVEDFYKRYGPMVLRRCRFLLRDEEKAADAMQDVFTKLLLSKDSLNNQYPSSLLYRMATNVCLNVIRAGTYRREVDTEDVLTNIAFFDEMEQSTIMNSVLDHIFKREKQSTREIAVLHFVDGLTLQQVADEVGLSLSGVRKRIRELRARIKTNKEDYYDN
ncbi:MAG: sigma-70 family RNA polymerase sigma factor [bacterium]|nr:sigma-70 family RNA polymerase sigma factor [bacterium]